MNFIAKSEMAKFRHADHRSSRQIATSMWDLAIWTYQVQKAHRDFGRVGGVGYDTRSMTAAVAEACHMGGAGGGGGASARTYADDDALTVHEMVLRRPGSERGMIIATAKTASVPDWSPNIPPFKVVPTRGRRGRDGQMKPRGIYDAHGNHIGCEIDYEGFAPSRAAEAVRHAREVYTDWWRALYALREALIACSGLKRWVVTGIGAEREPWGT